MMGWMLVFSMLLLCGVLATVGDLPGPGIISCLVFGFLLGVSAVTLLLRGEA
jgi:hypothetical protein